MQRFWYHSPVRFYKTQAELEDMTNPQNCQYFGEHNPYPLEKDVLHRFLIPNIDNEVDSTSLSMWLGSNQIPCEFGISDGKLFRVTFISYEVLSGNFEIKQGDETIYISNCVRFLDSTDKDGRKYIRVATKHYYNRYLFSFADSQFDWVITNLPAYDLGQFTIDSEFNTQRVGNTNSLIIADSFADEVVSYQFDCNGDSNILAFLQTHALNTEFYIDSTKRTIKEQPENDDFSMFGVVKFVNQKDEIGLNLIINEDDIFNDVLKYALGNNEKTAIYTYNNNNNAIPTN